MKTLMEIMEELTIYCKSITGKNCELKLTLPDEVIEHNSRQAKPKERIVLSGITQDSYINKIYGTGGTVEFVKESEAE